MLRPEKLSSRQQSDGMDMMTPGLKAATPRSPSSGSTRGGSFQTPSPKANSKSNFSFTEDSCATIANNASYTDNDLLPSYYGGHNNNQTPKEKVGLAMRKLKKRLLTTPPRKISLASQYLHDDRGHYSSHHNGSFSLSARKSTCSSRRSRTGMLLLLVCSMIGGVLYCLYYGYSFLTTSTNDPDTFHFRPTPPRHSPSSEAAQLFRKAYGTNQDGGIAIQDPLNPGSIFVILNMTTPNDNGNGNVMNNKNGESNVVTTGGPTYMEMSEFCLGYENLLLNHMTNLRAVRIPDNDHDSKDTMVQVLSYYSLVSRGLPHLAEANYATSDGRTVVVEIRFAIPPNVSEDNILDFQSSMMGAIKAYGYDAPAYVHITYTGLPFLQEDFLQRNITGNNNAVTALDNLLPPSAPSLQTYHSLAQHFGWGIVSPYRIIFDANDIQMPIDTSEGFHIIHQVLEELVKIDEDIESTEDKTEEELEMMSGIVAVNLDSIPQRIEDGLFVEHLGEVMDELFGETGYPIQKEEVLPIGGIRGHLLKPHMRTVFDGIAYLRNSPVPFPLYFGAKRCAEKNHPHCPVEMLNLFMYMTGGATSENRMTTYVTAKLGVDPFSDASISWLQKARERIKEMEGNGDLKGCKVAIDGGASVEYDVATFTNAVAYQLMLGFSPVIVLLGVLVVALCAWTYMRWSKKGLPMGMSLSREKGMNGNNYKRV